MQNFKIVELRNAQGSFIGWSVHPAEKHVLTQTYPLLEMAETMAILQRDAEAVLQDSPHPRV